MEQNLKLYVTFFVISLILWAAAMFVYTLVTPIREMKLIGEGNRAAACSLGGAALGLAALLGACSTITDVPGELATWALVGAAIQIAAFVVVALLLPKFRDGIRQDKLSYGIFSGAISLALGILNAGAIII